MTMTLQFKAGVLAERRGLSDFLDPLNPVLSLVEPQVHLPAVGGRGRHLEFSSIMAVTPRTDIGPIEECRLCWPEAVVRLVANDSGYRWIAFAETASGFPAGLPSGEERSLANLHLVKEPVIWRQGQHLARYVGGDPETVTASNQSAHLKIFSLEAKPVAWWIVPGEQKSESTS